MEIHAPSGDNCAFFLVHEHLLHPLSRLVRERSPRHQEDRLKWQCTINGHRMGPHTIKFFIHWLYHNSLGPADSANPGDLHTEDIEDHQLRSKIHRIQETCPQYSVAACKAALEKKRFNHNDALEYLASNIVQDNVCGLPQLLDLYIFANTYDIIVFKNVIIDHLIEEIRNNDVPPGWSKKIYSHTKSGDQLRRLWVDFYIWRVGERQLDVEQHEDSLDSTFLKDLVRAQARELRDNRIIENPPFFGGATIYHVRDESTGQCCCRTQFEGDKYKHREEFFEEQNRMQNAQTRVEELEYECSELSMALSEALRAHKNQGNRMGSQKRGSNVLPDGTE